MGCPNPPGPLHDPNSVLCAGWKSAAWTIYLVLIYFIPMLAGWLKCVIPQIAYNTTCDSPHSSPPTNITSSTGPSHSSNSNSPGHSSTYFALPRAEQSGKMKHNVRLSMQNCSDLKLILKRAASTTDVVNGSIESSLVSFIATHLFPLYHLIKMVKQITALESEKHSLLTNLCFCGLQCTSNSQCGLPFTCKGCPPCPGQIFKGTCLGPNDLIGCSGCPVTPPGVDGTPVSYEVKFYDQQTCQI